MSCGRSHIALWLGFALTFLSLSGAGTRVQAMTPRIDPPALVEGATRTCVEQRVPAKALVVSAPPRIDSPVREVRAPIQVRATDRPRRLYLTHCALLR